MSNRNLEKLPGPNHSRFGLAREVMDGISFAEYIKNIDPDLYHEWQKETHEAKKEREEKEELK